MPKGKRAFDRKQLQSAHKLKLQKWQQVGTSPWSRSRRKRALDIALALTLLVGLAPAMLLIGIAVKLTSRGPVFFRQRRLGYGGVYFEILKFRTMVYDRADAGPALTASGDSRLTLLGSVLRKWKLDEFPQLFNVVRGEMSFVGPRPKLKHLELTGAGTLAVRPGITGMATLAFRHEEALLAGLSRKQIEEFYVRTIAPLKVQLDLDYMRRATFASDLLLMVQTVLSVIVPMPGLHFSNREELVPGAADALVVANEKVWEGLAPTFES